MFYVSKVSKPFTVSGWTDTLYNEISVTNTQDGKTDVYNNKQLIELFHNQSILLYGCYFYGKSQYEMYAFCTPLQMNKKISKIKITELAKTNKKQHNPWSLYPIRDYLATLQIGTHFTISYKDRADGTGEAINGFYEIEKVDIDSWQLLTDYDNFGFISTSHLTSMLDYPLCCMYDIRIG